MIRQRIHAVAALLIGLMLAPAWATEVNTVVLTEELDHPWSLAFLPDHGMLITERPGRLRVFRNGALDPRPIEGLPKIVERGQGGLLDVVLHPQYARNGWVYLSYTAPGDGGYGTHIGRGRLKGHRLTHWQTLFRLEPKSRGGRHFGSRMVFSDDGLLYVTIGERGDEDRAQQLDDAAGSVLRLQDDGSIPQDNPFANTEGALPQIYSYGHRNPQGAALHPQTRQLWVHEHGPQGGDEINIVKAGANYGWPVITYGCQYVTCTRIGEGREKAGMEQPLHYWVPSIAPSGMTFYTGDKFPDWRGNLFVGSLKFHYLNRITLDGNKVVSEEKLLEGELGRIRDVRQGPDGYLYLLTDDDDGKLVRLEPAG